MNNEKDLAFERAMEDLQEQGYAVVVFRPEALQGADPRDIEDELKEYAEGLIETLKDPHYVVGEDE